ncbi:hypothetical protein [Chitinophaga sp. Cy-1792]|uniref:hypothetical protein n=1 Tax=Chitinophaga sp. Cy-1792 TaxID=2608339 RepID=UPI001423B812|nr:hypothetical protein [Chitinophaga sp. Cy-1792]NIG54846.1 hypothetical protein [Chitinophaga sp. Cy-1792]
MKSAGYFLALAVALAGACQNPQKHDEKESEKKAYEAAKSEQESIDADAARTENGAAAENEMIVANIDAAMARIPLPQFKNEDTKRMAEKFHKYLSNLVNANSDQKGNQYVDKLEALKKDYEKEVTAAKLDPDDLKKLHTYVDDLVYAVEHANP